MSSKGNKNHQLLSISIDNNGGETNAYIIQHSSITYGNIQ